MDWLTPALGSAVISMAVLVAAYAYLYGRRRQSAMGLWALGWTACLGLYFGLLAEMFLPLAMLWRYLSLVLLGLGAFLLWAGTRHFVGYPPPRRAYAWGVLPVIWAGVTFLGLEERPWLAIPIFLFASAASLFTAASLYRYSRSSEGLRGARVAALGYGLWGMLELVYPFVRIMLSPPLGVLPLGLLLANGLTLGLAISLIGLSMWDEERRARQQAEQLESLRTIAAAVSQVLEPDEVLSLVARQAAALVGAETVAVSLISEDGTHLLYKAAYGRWADQLFGQEKPIRSTSICGWVMRTRKGFHSEDLAQDERAVEEIGEMPWLETAISVPLLTRGKAIGAIVAFNKVGGGSFTYADLEQRLQPLADQAAVAIENARLYAAQQRRVQESRILLDIASVVSSTLDLNEVLKHVAQHVAQACGAHRCTILLLAGDEEMLIPLMSQFSDGHVDREMWRLFRDARYPVPVSQVLEMQQVIREQRPLFVPDASASSLPVHWIEPFGVKSVLIVPLVSKERVIGLMGLDHVEEGLEFTAEQVDLAMAIAAQAATAVENARLFEEERNSRRLANTLREIAQALNSTLSLNDVLNLILAELEKVIALDSGSIMLLEGKDLVIYAVKGFTDPDSVLRVRLDLDMAPLNREVVESKRPLIVGSAHEDERWLKPRKASGLASELHDVRSWMGIPLVVKDRVIGILTTDKVEGHFYSEKDAEVALAFAAQAALAIENARLFGETQQQARDLGLLYETGRLLASSLEATKVLDQIAQRCTEVLDADLTLVRLVENDWLVMKGNYFRDPAEREEVEGLLSAHPIRVGEAIAGRAAASGQPAIHRGEDVNRLTTPGYMAYLRTREWVVVPMRIGETITGVLTLIRRSDKGPFLERDLALAQGIADQVAIAIESARLFEETREHVARLERQTRDLELVHQVSQVVSSSLDLTRILETAAEQMVAVFEADHSGILLFDQAQTYGQVVAEYPSTGATAERFPVQGYLAAERIITDREPLVIEDAWNDPLMATVREAMHRLDIRSMLIVPLIVKGEVVGSIGLDAVGRQRRFNAEEVALAQTIANQVVIAIENARLFEEAQRRWQEPETLYRAAQALATTLDLRQVFECILSELQQVVPYDSASVQLLRDGYLEIIGGHGFPNLDELLGITFDLSKEDNPSREVIRRRAPFIVEDAPAVYPGFRGDPHVAAGIRAWLGVPLLFGDQLIGMLALDKREPGFYTSEHARLASAFAVQAAIAIENARLYGETKRWAEEMAALHETTLDITAQLEMPRLLNAIIGRASDLLGATGGLIHLYDPARERLVVVTSHNLEKDYTELTLEVGEGVAGKVFQTGEPLIIDDHRTWVGKSSQLADADARSILGVPLKWQERILGVLGIMDNVRAGAFDEHDLWLLMPLANQAAIAIQNARLFEEAKQRARQLEALTEIGRAIGSILNLDEVLQLILERLEDVVPYDAVSLWLREGEAMHIRAVRGFEGTEAHIGFAVTLQEDRLSREMVSTRRPLILADAQQDERFRGLAGTEWVCSWLGVPLLSKGEVIGLVTLNKKEPGLYTAEMAALALAFGQQAAMAIENARLFEETKQRAEEMTALYHTSLEIPTNLPDLLWTICDRAAGLLDVDKGGLYLYDEAREELELVVSYKLGRDFTGTRIKLGEGVAGRVVQTGQPLIVDDYSHWDERTRVYEGEPFATVIGVPLKWQERVIGAISLSEETGRRTFTPDDERLLGLFAQQAAVAIENARLYEGARRHVEELTALHTIDVTIASTLDLDEVLQRVYGQVSTVMDVAAFHIALYDEEKGELHLPIIVDQGRRLPPRTLKVEEESGLSGWVVRTREPLWIEDWDEQRDTLPVKAIALGIPTRSLMVLPLVARDKVVGVMSAQSYEPYAFDEGHRRLFSGIASQVAIVIENARLFEETNRRLAEVRLTQEVMLASASTLDFDLVLERTVKALHRALGIARLGFLLPDEQGGALVPHPSLVGFTEGAFRIPIKGSLVGQAYRTGQPVLVRDVAQEPAYSEVAPGVHSALAVPVRVGDRIIAVLHAESLQVGAFGEDELRLFTTIAGQLGVTLESARLYQRLEVQTTELSQSYGELQEISRLRTELVQNVGHELRTPLGLIQGYVELLLEGDLGRILDSQQAALQVIRERSATLARLIHNLTMLQAVPQGALALAPASVVEVVQHALAEFRRFAEKADIAFQEELPAGLPPVLGDRERLELVFGHLVDNAIKFSPDGGTVTVRAWADENQVYVSVADEGIGIAPDHLDRVFERFYQVDGTTKRRFGGMGVGLALVWEVVEAHGGTVTVESEPGEGSTFTVALPQAEESPVD